MSNNIFRAVAIATLVGTIGFGGAALASADEVLQPGRQAGAFCTVVAEDGTVTHLQTRAQCLQARISIDIDERNDAREKALEERRDDRRADRTN